MCVCVCVCVCVSIVDPAEPSTPWTIIIVLSIFSLFGIVLVVAIMITLVLVCRGRFGGIDNTFFYDLPLSASHSYFPSSFPPSLHPFLPPSIPPFSPPPPPPPLNSFKGHKHKSVKIKSDHMTQSDRYPTPLNGICAVSVCCCLHCLFAFQTLYAGGISTLRNPVTLPHQLPRMQPARIVNGGTKRTVVILEDPCMHHWLGMPMR